VSPVRFPNGVRVTAAIRNQRGMGLLNKYKIGEVNPETSYFGVNNKLILWVDNRLSTLLV